ISTMTNNHIPPDVRLRNLFEKGSAVDVHKNIPIRRYFRSCQELIRMAGVYFDEKNFENSYVFYAKFIVLSFEKLKTHPEFNNVPASEKLANKRSLKIAFERAEKLKPALKKKYEEEYKIYLANKKKQEILAKQEEEKRKKTEENERIRKEEEKKKEEEEQMNAFVREQKRKELELERLAIEAEFAEKAKIDDDVPLVPTSFAPPPPVVNQIPAKPDPTPLTQPAIPTYDRALKPPSTDLSLTQSKNQYGLRTILSPADLPQKFMALVHTNTARNIETCGVLFGKLANEVFVLTHVLIPHQKGAPDSCDTTREEDMWDFQDQYNGICLGWIHTHPSQTAFLSSVDMHTHYPYQCLMPESVAIVCSGKFNETGYFMLDPGRGMNEIGNCRKHGFHPHPTTPPLFESCDHVKTSTAHSIQLIDWR
uniref:MPN domain-containing protein n=1 Tax=Ciona savignyi TaxID=51511 RepID=H2Y550_CIOSA